jgi:hypothetical protein
MDPAHSPDGAKIAFTRENDSGALFQVRQSTKPSAKGLTELGMKGSSFRASAPRGAAESTRTIRRVRASAKGRFRWTTAATARSRRCAAAAWWCAICGESAA